MMVNKHKNPIAQAIGFLLILLLTACQSEKTPIELTEGFWSAIAKNKLGNAQAYCSSQQSQQLSPSLYTQLKDMRFDYGKIVIDGNQSNIETHITPPSKQQSTFTTFLVLEEESWKIDCQRSLNALAGNQAIGEFFKNLSDLGKNINEQLQQQLPIIEKEIEAFEKELKHQINEFGNELEKSFPQQQQQQPHPDTI